LRVCHQTCAIALWRLRLARAASLALAVVLCAAPCAPAAAAAAFQPTGAPPGEHPPIHVDGASVIQYDAVTQQYLFRGPRVVATRGSQRLVAPEIRYDGVDRRAVLPRGGTISTPTMALSADLITAELDARHLLADGHVTGRMLDRGVWTSLAADRVEVDDRPDVRRAVATGDVVVARAGEEVRGDRLTYDRLAGHGEIDGHVVMTRGEDRLQADRIIVDLGTNDAEALGHVILDRRSRRVRGTADRATYDRDGQTATLSGHARLTRGQDVLTADEITMDLTRNLAVADGHPQIIAYPQPGESIPEP
jgi:lipopolysaccharide transport protein LptA